jgi:hypothetical protein
MGKGLRDELAPADPTHRVDRPDVTPRTVIHDRGMAPHRASSTCHLYPPFHVRPRRLDRRLGDPRMGARRPTDGLTVVATRTS